MTPQELVDRILTERDGYSDEECLGVESIARQMSVRGITQRQLNYLRALYDENEAYKAGYTPYDQDYAYRVGL